MSIQIRKSEERGYFDYEWLRTFHTFSFGNYQDSRHKGFRTLRVLNENRVRPGVGFPIEAHRDMEIMSIVIEGGLAHQDDRANGSIIRPGYVQLTSAGRGITHSETNASDKEEVHFLQIWIVPEAKNLEPSYQEQLFPNFDQPNTWILLASREGRDHSLTIHQNVNVLWGNLTHGHLTYDMAEGRYGWLQVVKGEVRLNGQHLQTGDGASISEVSQIDIEALIPSQLLFFDLN